MEAESSAADGNLSKLMLKEPLPTDSLVGAELTPSAVESTLDLPNQVVEVRIFYLFFFV